MRVATVTLLAHSERPFEEMIPAEYWRRPWAEHPKVEVEIKPEETLASAFRRAAEHFNLTPPSEGLVFDPDYSLSRLMFFKPEDVDSMAVPRPRTLNELTLIDRHGLAVFGVYNWRTVTFQQLMDSAEAGVLEGDPLRPYLLVELPYGDAPPVDWPTFKAALDVTWDVLQALGTIGGAKWALDGIKGRLSRGREALSRNWTFWSQRSQRPDQFQSLFDNRSWRTAEIAKLLDCSEEDAAGILGLFGFELAADGYWSRPGGDEEHSMRVIYEQTDFAYRRLYSEWEPTFRTRIETYFTTGDDPGYADFEDESDEKWRDE